MTASKMDLPLVKETEYVAAGSIVDGDVESDALAEGVKDDRHTTSLFGSLLQFAFCARILQSIIANYDKQEDG